LGTRFTILAFNIAAQVASAASALFFKLTLLTITAGTTAKIN
jgi:hypothetical protein